MKRNVFGVLASVAVAGILVGAQEAQPPASPQPGAQAPTTQEPRSPQPPPAASQDRDSSVTLTGCLIQGSGPSVFLLENAKVGSAASVAPSAGQSAAMPGQTYVIDSTGASVNLKSDLNHQVTITGTLAATTAGSSMPKSDDSRSEASRPGASSSSSGAGQSSSVGAPSSSSSSMSAQKDESKLPRLSAKSVKKIADTCSAAD